VVGDARVGRGLQVGIGEAEDVGERLEARARNTLEADGAGGGDRILGHRVTHFERVRARQGDVEGNRSAGLNGVEADRRSGHPSP